MTNTIRYPAACNQPGEKEAFCFDEGLNEIRRRIEALLGQQNMLTIGINGAGPQVGKTYLSGQIAQGLLRQAVPTGVCLYPDELSDAYQTVLKYRDYFDNLTEEAYIFEGWEVPHGIRQYGDVDLRQAFDKRLEDAASKLGLSIKKIDLWIALYSRRVPFVSPPGWADEPYDPFEDLVIFNDGARRR